MKKLVTLLTLLCLSVWTNAEKVKIDGIWYELESTGKTAEVTYDIGTNYSDEVVIPETVTHGYVVYNVTSIGGSAFHYCSNLTSIIIGNSVTSIGEWAFNKCSNLTSITIPNSVTSIGEYAFYDCPSLTSITIGNSVTSIREQTFFGCSSLTGITIPNSVTSIGEQAFDGCSSLTSIIIGNSVTSIGERAFNGCSGLTSIVVEEGNTVYDSRENCNAIIETVTNTLFYGCQSTVIPNSVTGIDEEAFYSCSGMTSIVVEEGNTVYDSRENCNAIIETATNTLISGCQSTVIPNSVTGIGWWAFYGRSGLTSITIPNSVEHIGNSTFKGCKSLTNITIPNSVTSIGNKAFSGCKKLTNVYCHATRVPSTDDKVFQSCGIESATLYVPQSAINDYKTTFPWSRFGTIVALTDKPNKQ